jgi:hypothetical protein
VKFLVLNLVLPMATTGLCKVNSVLSSNDLFGYKIYCYFNDQLHVYVYIALVEGDDVSADAEHRNKQEGNGSLLDRN